MSAFLRKNIFNLVAWGCGLFVLLTLVAMLAYQGGNYQNLAAPAYDFTHNFFSDLGRTVAHSGKPNWPSAILFFIALFVAGAGLVIFFLVFPRFFTHKRPLHLLSLAGSLVGVLAGLCFIGVAFTPSNLSRGLHTQFVLRAFQFFPLAVFIYIPALFLNRSYPRRYAWIFVVFWLLLMGYYVLLNNGPDIDTSQGLVIQAVGQKIIVYASILSIGLQALGAKKYQHSQQAL